LHKVGKRKKKKESGSSSSAEKENTEGKERIRELDFDRWRISSGEK
jgi:hypothetical protein